MAGSKPHPGQNHVPALRLVNRLLYSIPLDCDTKPISFVQCGTYDLWACQKSENQRVFSAKCFVSNFKAIGDLLMGIDRVNKMKMTLKLSAAVDLI